MEAFVTTQLNNTMQQYYARCREAGQHHAEEQQAAVVLQACWRGHLQRQELKRLRVVAVTIQKCWRGYLGRCRFAAALAARNTQQRQDYFNRHATTIQRCWRGHFSRTHIHDFYKRKAFLQSVAAANAAVRAEMDADLQAALSYQQQEAQARAKSHFDAQVSTLHYLSSTASIPGIFSPPATASAAAASQQVCCTVAGQALEQHLRAAVKHKAKDAARRQQAALLRILGKAQQGGGMFPAGVPQHGSNGRSSTGGTQCYEAAGPPAARQLQASVVRVAATALQGGAAGGHCQQHTHSSSATAPAICCGSSCRGPQQQTTWATSSKGSGASSKQGNSSRGGSKPQLQEQKLAHKIVEARVDQVFAAKSAANMPDGGFNPGLSLQQSTDYEAAREAADLDRRLERGLMLALHHGRPFVPVLGKHPLAADSAVNTNKAADSSDEQSRRDDSSSSMQLASVEPRVCSSPEPEERMHFWRHNKHSGGMFSKHLKQVY